MHELAELHRALIEESLAGRFREALAASPLGGVVTREHPLGFRVAKLSSDDGSTLRLHVWPSGAKSEQPGFEVHNHGFDFVSHVVMGELDHLIFDSVEQPEGRWAQYRVQYDPEGRSILSRCASRFDLVLRSQERIGTKQTYATRATDLHTLQGTTCRPTVTLVLTKPHANDIVTMGPFDGPMGITSERSTLGSTALQEFNAVGMLS